MWEVIAFPDVAKQDEWWELLQTATKNITNSEVSTQVEMTHNWFVQKFPHVFMNPWELITYLESLRAPEWYNEGKPLIDQVADKNYIPTWAANDNQVPVKKAA